MLDLLNIIGLTLIAGICIPIGGLLAKVEHIRSNWLENEFRHFVIAFGGGILLGAVAEVLIPEGIERVGHSLWAIPLTCCGGLSLFAIEHFLGVKADHSVGTMASKLDSRIVRHIRESRRKDSPQLMGMLLDYVPEAIALGGLVALQSPKALLLALLMAMQNLPEGFNTYRELMVRNMDSRKTLLLMGKLALLGPIAGVSGFLFLSSRPYILGGIMLFSSGGILYLIFQDIAPQSRLEKHWAPPLGAVFGFSLAIFSEMVMHPSL